MFVLTIVVGDSASDRLAAAFRFGPLAKGADARLDAWITPPAYTGKAPVMLADGAYHHYGPNARAADQPGRPARGAGPQRADRALERCGGATSPSRSSAATASRPRSWRRRRLPISATCSELKYEVRRSGTVIAKLGGTTVGSWPFQVIPDLPPKISITKEPERTPRGGLKFAFKVEDDYGVASAETRIRRVAPKEDTSRPPGPASRPRRARGLPTSGRRRWRCRLPRSYPKQAEGTSFHEIGDHPWAGMKVQLTLVAKDLAGQTGRSETIELVLPERRFTKPLARAVVEQRRKLVEDPRDRLQVARALEALTLEPEQFIDDLQVYLGLRSVYLAPAAAEPRAPIRNSVIAQLWNVALRIEDGNLTDAERALKAAQERLSKAIEEGASDEEIQRLMQELRQALAQFLEQLRKQAEGQQQHAARHQPQPDDDAARSRSDAAEPREHGALGQPRHGPADAEPAARPAGSPAVGPHGRPGPEPAHRPDDGRVRRHHLPPAAAA